MNLKNWVLIETSNLKKNMIIAKDIYNENAKLLTKNTILDKNIIKFI